MPVPSAPVPPQRVSLVMLTAASLRASLEAGHWQGHLPGERELCARLQVSRHTLRAALEELQKQGWLEVAERSRRRIRVPAVKTENRDLQTVAVLSAHPLQSLPPSLVVMVDELRDKLAQAGHEFVFHVSPACFGDRPARALQAVTARSPAAVWLLLGSQEPLQSWFAQRELPCLVVGSCAPGVELPSVDADFRAACRHAGALLRRRGHREIVLIRPEGEFGGDRESEAGLREALSERPEARLRVLRHRGDPEQLAELLGRLLDAPRPPTACVVARAVHTLTVMMVLLRRGVRIPEEMAVIARDDEMFLRHTVPAVTRYTASPVRLARSVFNAARQLAAKERVPGTVRVMPQWIRGDSV